MSDEESSTPPAVIVSQNEIEALDTQLEAPEESSFPDNCEDDSTTSTNTQLRTNDISKRLSTSELSLWKKFETITCIDEFEKQLESEDEEDENGTNRRSTRIFNGLIFN